MIRSTHLLALLASLALFACHHTTQRIHDATRNGEEVAQAMNARFYDTVAACSDNKPAYYCSGVFVRTGPETDGFWNPRQGDDRYVVSFSYLRNDVGLRAIFTGQAGYSLKPASAWGTDGLHELTVRCAFAFNAFTEDRGPYGCGATKSDPIESGPCLDQGIVTKEAFAKHYTSVGEPNNPGDFAKRGAHQCSFGVDPFSFELSILGRMEGRIEPGYSQDNEVVVNDWPLDTPAQFPVESVFYYESDSARTTAQQKRDAYQRATGIVLPVIRFTRDESVPPFSYRPEDQ